MGNITDVDRGLHEAQIGLDSAQSRAVMVQRMHGIARMQGKDYVRTEMWNGVDNSLRRGWLSPRWMLESGRFDSEDHRLLYLRFIL